MSKRLLGELELNRIYQRECIEGMRMIPDKSIDMILCDLPYGTTQAKWDSVIPFKLLWESYERVIKDNGAIVLTASQPFTSSLIMSNRKLFKYTWVWDKNKPTGFLNAKKQPLRVTEDICVFYKNQPTYNPQLRDKEKKNIRNSKYDNQKQSELYGKVNEIWGYNQGREIPTDKSYPVNLIHLVNIGNNKGQRIHPTQKPIELFEYLIKTYTNEGEVVLDNCMGSGTTAIAAIRTGRQFIGFELEREYVEKANKRIDNELEAE